MKIKNKKAHFNFEFLEKEICGIVLKGSEIKSISLNNVGFTDTYCFFKDGEMFVKNLHISEYGKGSEHDPKRDKKLLLTKKQLEHFESQINEKGLTIVPTMIFINEKGKCKLEIALSRGKREYDKKNSIIYEEEKRRIKDDYNFNI